MKSRNNRLLLLIGSLLLVGFVITSLASFFVSRDSLRREISTNALPLTSDNVYSEIQRDLLKPVFISSLMASDTFVRDWLLAGEADPQKATKYLKAIQEKYNTFTTFLVSHKTSIYYQADGILKKVSESEPRDKWYFRARDMGDEYEINVDADMANHDSLTIFVNHRVYDYDKKFIGVIGIGLSVGSVRQLIDDYEERYARSIIFADAQGSIRLSSSVRESKESNVLERMGFPPLTKKMHTGNTVFSYHNGDQLIHANIRYISEFDWFLIVEQNDDSATESLWIALAINMSICLPLTLLVLILVFANIARYAKSIETLRGIIPICSYCKGVLDDDGYWNRVETYVARHTEAKFSHGICPPCTEKHFPEDRPDKRNPPLR